MKPETCFPHHASPSLPTPPVSASISSLRHTFPISAALACSSLLAEEKALVNGSVCQAVARLHGGEEITILGDPQPPPLRAIAEDIPLDIVYEDDDLAVINKPAGMMVHAGAGATEDERNRGTLVNALLHRFG